jgi:hypothetical protein
MKTRSMGSHHKPNEGKSNDWLTPPEIVQALGPFELDPCASEEQPWTTAAMMWTVQDDGLSRDWGGFVWLNPPYGPHVWRWLSRLADHGNGIALVFARTETKGFHQQIWNRADCLYFFAGRLHFHWPQTGERAKFNAGAPSVLVGYGDEARERLRAINRFKIPGRFVSNNL